MTRRTHRVPPAVDDDPFAVLGLPAGATAAQVFAARRRLAKSLHPDVGGDADQMRRVNAAVSSALRRLGGPTGTAAPAPPSAAATPTSPSQREATSPGRFVNDAASFTIEALRAEAFEALLVVTAWIGELLVDDPPDALEVLLHEPATCWCRLDLVPDAGATTVGLTLASIEGEPLPHIDLVRDTWVAELNRLDWDELEAPGPPRPS